MSYNIVKSKLVLSQAIRTAYLNKMQRCVDFKPN